MINEQQPIKHYTSISTHEIGEIKQDTSSGAKAFFSKKKHYNIDNGKNRKEEVQLQREVLH